MISDPQRVILLGASVRALAGSALRAGLVPYAIDQFADLDLQARCPTERLSGSYPEGFVEALERAPPAPWIYTGGLENHPRLLERLAEIRPAWGIVGPTLRAVRCHGLLNQRLHRAGLTVPWVRLNLTELPEYGRWLLKPRRSSGGRGIRPLDPTVPLTPEEQQNYYLQEQVGGISASAIFLGDGLRTRLIGLTMQLVGTRYLGAKPFQYCGSVGPIPLSHSLLSQLRYLGRTLGTRSKLRGLFGVDGIVRNHEFWVVEVNPRYTASMEILEYLTGQPLLALHRKVFDRQAPLPVPFSPTGPVVGKAVVYAPYPVRFPQEGPWTSTVTAPPTVTKMPAYADIPPAGSSIDAGQPVLTVLGTGTDIDDCLANLQHQAGLVLRALEGARVEENAPTPSPP